MNLLNLLIKEKRTAGVEISSQFIRIAYFRPRKKFSRKIRELAEKLPEHELVLIEEPLSANIIEGGIVQDKKLLGKILKDVWTRTKLGADYAIVSIPENKIYSHIFPFPKTVDESRLEEAVNMAINFQLPLKKSEVYVGFENAGDSNVLNEVLVSSIPKTVADAYIESLNYAGIKILALESHLSSIVRSIKLPLGQATLFSRKDPDGTRVFILKDNIIEFSRTLPNTFIQDDKRLANEIEHIKNSFEFEKKMPLEGFPFSQALIRDEYLKYPELNGAPPEIQSKWLTAIGAAMRGEIPKGKDNHISLLPIGTAEAYAYQKALTFIELVRNIIIVVSLFFLATFLGTYLFILSLSKTSNTINSNLASSPISQDLLQKKAWVRRINSMDTAAQVILSNTINWSLLLQDIYSHVVDNIAISNFTVTSINDPISLVGLAKDRDTLNQLKKSLQASTYLTAVELPITNLEQKADIPFSISFRVKDPSMLYYK